MRGGNYHDAQVAWTTAPRFVPRDVAPGPSRRRVRRGKTPVSASWRFLWGRCHCPRMGTPGCFESRTGSRLKRAVIPTTGRARIGGTHAGDEGVPLPVARRRARGHVSGARAAHPGSRARRTSGRRRGCPVGVDHSVRHHLGRVGSRDAARSEDGRDLHDARKRRGRSVAARLGAEVRVHGDADPRDRDGARREWRRRQDVDAADPVARVAARTAGRTQARQLPPDADPPEARAGRRRQGDREVALREGRHSNGDGGGPRAVRARGGVVGASALARGGGGGRSAFAYMRASARAALAGVLALCVIAGCARRAAQAPLKGDVPAAAANVGTITLPEVHAEGADSPFRLVPAAGHVLVVYFGYTTCPDVCPTTLSDLHRALATMGDAAHRVDVAFVTVDRERDTPAQLAPYLAAFVAGGHS